MAHEYRIEWTDEMIDARKAVLNALHEKLKTCDAFQLSVVLAFTLGQSLAYNNPRNWPKDIDKVIWGIVCAGNNHALADADQKDLISAVPKGTG